ncbi:MAG: hypothetical protein N2606_01815 [Candidatus Omnitrophica bacterium]|nr:hypothetical protein [Candidatus Omnitrophota bacterium]
MLQKAKNYTKLVKSYCKTQGCSLVGIADISNIKEEFSVSQSVMEKMSYAICFGLQLSKAILAELVNQPTRLYFHHYRTVNTALDQIALKISNFIQQKGFLALPIPASQILDWQRQTAHLSHKKIALLAGIGWLGRNNLLVTEEFGSQIRLATVLTDMPLLADKPIVRDCALCRACISVCPAQAIKESPQDFEYLKCFEKLKEFQRQHLVDQYVCGVCVNVCGPKVKKSRKSQNNKKGVVSAKEDSNC